MRRHAWIAKSSGALSSSSLFCASGGRLSSSQKLPNLSGRFRRTTSATSYFVHDQRNQIKELSFEGVAGTKHQFFYNGVGERVAMIGGQGGTTPTYLAYDGQQMLTERDQTGFTYGALRWGPHKQLIDTTDSEAGTAAVAQDHRQSVQRVAGVSGGLLASAFGQDWVTSLSSGTRARFMAQALQRLSVPSEMSLTAGGLLLRSPALLTIGLGSLVQRSILAEVGQVGGAPPACEPLRIEIRRGPGGSYDKTLPAVKRHMGGGRTLGLRAGNRPGWILNGYYLAWVFEVTVFTKGDPRLCTYNQYIGGTFSFKAVIPLLGVESSGHHPLSTVIPWGLDDPEHGAHKGGLPADRRPVNQWGASYPYKTYGFDGKNGYYRWVDSPGLAEQEALPLLFKLIFQIEAIPSSGAPPCATSPFRFNAVYGTHAVAYGVTDLNPQSHVYPCPSEAVVNRATPPDILVSEGLAEHGCDPRSPGCDIAAPSYK